MSSAIRYLVYLICAGGFFVVGRFLFPASNGVFSKQEAKDHRATAAREFWTEAMRQALVADTELKRSAAVLELLDRVSPADLPAVAEVAREHPFQARLVAARWADGDAAGLFKYLASKGLKSPVDHEMAGILMHAWAQANLNDAQAAAARLKVTGAPVDINLALSLALIRQDVKKGIEFARRQGVVLPATLMMQELEVDRQSSVRWNSAPAVARIDFLQSIPPSRWRDAALDVLYSKWVTNDPKSFLLAAQETSRDFRQIDAAITNWMAKEPDAVVSFFQKGAKDQVRSAIGVVLARQGAEKDPQNAWDFAQWNLAGRPRADAYRAIIESVSSSDPLRAWTAWVSDAPDEPWRRESVRIVARDFQAKDAAAAEAWFATLHSADQAPAAAGFVASPSYPEQKRAELKERFKLE